MYKGVALCLGQRSLLLKIAGNTVVPVKFESAVSAEACLTLGCSTLELDGSIYIAPHGVSLVEPEGSSWQTQPVFLRLLTVHHTLFHTIGTGVQSPGISARNENMNKIHHMSRIPENVLEISLF